MANWECEEPNTLGAGAGIPKEFFSISVTMHNISVKTNPVVYEKFHL
jgi:hypothetical protein